ncbi:hypothetical protein [Rhizorhabdus dicambivorans]|nr:hypothetical protein [Rhizorhabdus dicambivorans]
MRGSPGAEEPGMDTVTAKDAPKVAEPRPAARPSAGRSSGDDRKWPLATRVAFIAGSAAALWGLIYLGYRAL